AAAVETDDRADLLARGELLGRVLRNLVELTEFFELLFRLRQRRPGALTQARLATRRDVLAKAIEALEPPDVRVFLQAVEDGAERGVVLRVLGDEDELLDGDVFRIVVTALLPNLRNA